MHLESPNVELPLERKRNEYEVPQEYVIEANLSDSESFDGLYLESPNEEPPLKIKKRDALKVPQVYVLEANLLDSKTEGESKTKN